MSATPIPRSLAMVLYGDMEVSFVDEMPPGRTPVQTKVFAERERRQVYSIVLDELKRGHQAFVVLPLVEASEQLEQVRDATQMAEKMRQTLFKDFGIGLVHGRLKTEERDEIMRSFRDGKLGHFGRHHGDRSRYRYSQRHRDGRRACRALRAVAIASTARPGRARLSAGPLFAGQPWHGRRAGGRTLARNGAASTTASRLPKPICACAVRANCLARASPAWPTFALPI